MNKVKLYIITNFRINKRINSEKNPIAYYWLKSLGINLPPDILAYLLLILLLSTCLTGMLAETTAINYSGRLNVLYSSGILAITLIIVEIVILTKRIYINNILNEILPLTKSEYILIKIIGHFFSLRTINFTLFVFNFIVFSYSYDLILFDKIFLVDVVLFFDIFIMFSTITFLLTNSFSLLKINFNKNILSTIRFVFLLILFILIKKIYTNNILLHNYSALQSFIQGYILLITCISLSFFITIFYLCSYERA